jgi:hypothetical protein
MQETADPHGGNTNTDAVSPTPAQLEAEIEQTREQLGRTVDALAARLDVKHRAKARAAATKQRVAGQLASVRRIGQRAMDGAGERASTSERAVPIASLAVAGAALLVVTTRVWRRRR